MDIESREVAGITVPLALGETVNSFVGSAFSLLFDVSFFGFCVVILFLARGRVAAKAPIRVFRLIMLGALALLGWAAWRSWPQDLENLRALL